MEGSELPASYTINLLFQPLPVSSTSLYFFPLQVLCKIAFYFFFSHLLPLSESCLQLSISLPLINFLLTFLPGCVLIHPPPPPPCTLCLHLTTLHPLLGDWSLFITWGGGGVRRIFGDQLMFRRTEGGISHSREPKRGITRDFGRIPGGGPLKSAWTMPDMGGHKS